MTDHTALWKFGVLNPQAEHSFPVYCFLGQTSSQLDKIVNQLCMGEQTFLLIAATSSLISTASSDASSRHKSKLIGIDDVLAVDGTGKVTAKDSAQTIVSNWLETVLPKSAKPNEAKSRHGRAEPGSPILGINTGACNWWAADASLNLSTKLQKPSPLMKLQKLNPSINSIS